MAALDELCDLLVEPTPCTGAEERRNWMAVFRMKELLCELFGDDGDDPLDEWIIPFELTATLTPGGSAAAVKLSFPGGVKTTGAAITVHDVETSTPWRGISGYFGWARRREPGNDTDFLIIRMERIAKKIRGTLAGDLSGGSASANVAAFDEGRDPGSTVTVHDPLTLWPQALTGATYVAKYDYKLARYELETCQVTEWSATAEAAQNFGPSDTTVSIRNVTFKTFPDQDDDPATPTTAENFLGLMGLDGDPLHLQRRYPDGQWEIINCPSPGGSSGTPVIYFKTTLPLHIGGSTSAVRLERQGGTFVETDSVQVFDPYAFEGGRGMWSGPSGLKGMARQREDDPTHYDIIWMEMHARFIHFQLTENMGATTSQEATASVVYAWGQGVSPGATVTVHDDGNKFKYALAGAWGTAIRNEYLGTSTPSTPYYTIVVCDQMAMHGAAQLTSNSCGGAFPVTQFQGWTIFPHGQTPPLGTVNSLNNMFKLAGRESDPVFCVFRDKSGGSGGKDFEYVAIQVKHEDLEVVIDNRFHQGCWEHKKQRIHPMVCEDPGEFEAYICGQDCP